MTDSTIIGLLITAMGGLVTALVYLFKKGERRERETQQLVKDALSTIHDSNVVTRNADEVLKRVEKLLLNWRGH